MRSLVAVASLALLAVAAPAAAQDVQFHATVDRDKVEVGDTFTLTVTLNVPDAGRVSGLTLPQAAAFTEVSRSEGTHVTFTFGAGGRQVQNVTTHVLVLRADETGARTLPAGRLTYDGREYRTKPITLSVMPVGTLQNQQPAQPQRRPPTPFGQLDPFDMDPFDLFGQDPFQQGSPTEVRDDDVFMTAELDRDEVYLGEQITMSLRVYSRFDVGQFPGLRLPKLDGFWTEDLDSPSRIVPKTRTIRGVRYRVHLIRRTALFPLKAGEVTIGPAEVDIMTAFGLFRGGRTVTRKSRPVKITVKPLPAEGQPPGFESTNVGTWRLSALAEPRETETGQPVTLRVTASGTGNLDSLVLPEPGRLDGFKTYDPTRSQDVSIRGGRFGGTKSLEWVLVPTRSGTLTIPALELHTFDPAGRRYVTRRTEPVTIRVTAGSGAAGPAVVGALPSAGAAANVLDASGLRSIRYGATVQRVGPPPYRSPLFLLLLAVPALAFAGVVLSGAVRDRLRRDEAGGRGRRAPAIARARLKEARKHRRSARLQAAFGAVEKALVQYLSDRTGLPARGLARDQLRQELLDRGYGGLRIDRLLQVLEDCETARYSPVPPTPEEVDRLLQRAGRVLADLETGPGQEVAA